MHLNIEKTPQEKILGWYDIHQRVLPWRKSSPDPYEVLLSEFMLQQTTVATVIEYFERFVAKWPRIESLANAEDGDILAQWAGLGYYARARNLIKTARYIAALKQFPNTSKSLIECPGIGPYTSAAIASIAFGEVILPQDGNINRILSRLFCITDPIDRPSLKLSAAAMSFTHQDRPGDLAQAMMDLGAMICRPKNPNCTDCPIQIHCKAFELSRIDELPQKAPKRAKAIWETHIYVLENQLGEIAFERRDDKSLLGGMWGLPTSEWGADPQFTPPIQGDWIDHGSIHHIFTHIDLTAHIHALKLTALQFHNEYSFFSSLEMPLSSLPKLWRKALEQFHKSSDN